MATDLNGNTIGTSRVNYYSVSKALPYYDSLYDLANFSAKHDGKISIITRYMVKAEYRNTNLGVYLALSTVFFCLKNNVKWLIMDCNKNLHSYFEKLGFTTYIENAKHENYGNVKIMLLNLDMECFLTAPENLSKVEKLIKF